MQLDLLCQTKITVYLHIISMLFALLNIQNYIQNNIYRAPKFVTSILLQVQSNSNATIWPKCNSKSYIYLFENVKLYVSSMRTFILLTGLLVVFWNEYEHKYANKL